MIKRFFGIALLAGGLAVPAYAQASHGAAAGGMANSLGSGGGGGGGFGGGFSSGASAAVSYPRAQFSVASVSGSESDYRPSKFVSYDQAVAIGRAIPNAPAESLGDVARRAAVVPRERAKLAFLQDDSGRAIIVSR